MIPRQTIEVTPDAVDGHLHYTVKPGDTVTFLGGFSTVRFVVRTPSRVFYYAFPLSFGAKADPLQGTAEAVVRFHSRPHYFPARPRRQ